MRQGLRRVVVHWRHRNLRPADVAASRRVVYLVRDVRAVAVSYFHHLRRMGAFAGDLDQFCSSLAAGRVGNLWPWSRHDGLALARDPTTLFPVLFADAMGDVLTRAGYPA